MDDRIESRSHGRFEHDLGRAGVCSKGLFGLPRIQRVDGGRVDNGLAPIDRRLHRGRIEHIPRHGVRFVDPERSERRADPLRSTNQETHGMAGPDHRRHCVRDNEARSACDEDAWF